MANFLDLMKRKMIFIKLLAAFLGLWLAGLLLACANPPSSLTPVPPPLPPELILYDWEGDMPQAVLDGFTQAYGVKIIYEVYESQEEAIEKLRAGRAYDVVVIESRVIPLLVQEGLLAQLDYRHIPNFKNISANFRDLIYDPSNQHTIPYNWGTTGLVVRSDLVTAPVTRWADLWNPRYAGRVGIWQGQPREVLALTLKSLGYSANSEKPAELEAALTRLLLLKPNLLFIEDYDLASSASLMASGQAIISMGYAGDVLQGREENRAITYVLPQEGALLWGDNFAIPATSAHQQAAALFLNYLLQPEVNAQIANENLYATPNEAARPFIKPEILNDPIIFPPEQDIKNSELILPLSPAGQELYNDIWERFLAAN
jgi:spermidine/putrescine transport system substrate-binding protein